MAKHIKPRNTTPRNDISAEFVRSQLSYNRKTGVVRWKVRRSQRTPVGSIAGTDHLCGYRSVSFTLRPYTVRRYYLHRIIFLMVTGRWPKQDIDHINGNKRDNRWKNLREATRSENNFNAVISRRNTSGLRGVSKRYSNRWVAQIRIDGRQIWLGAFVTKHDANIAYITAAKIFRKKFVSFTK